MNKQESYSVKRPFSDYVHNNIAIPQIYDQLEWEEIEECPRLLKYLDQKAGFDYFFDTDQGVKSIQERFRVDKFKSYNDFTVTYTIGSQTDDNYYREWFKIRSDFFLYGITNTIDINFPSISCTRFHKWALINWDRLKLHYLRGEICLDNEPKKPNCKVVGTITHQKNSDTTFISFDIPALDKNFDDVIIHHYGYNVTSEPVKIDNGYF